MKWKTKTGERIGAKEFFRRLKLGIESITPLQRLQNEQRATFIMLIGYSIGLISLVIYRELFIVQWFTFALIIIFLGATYGQVIKLFALRTQLKLFTNLSSESLDLDKVFENMEEETDNAEKMFREQKDEQQIISNGKEVGMDSQTIKMEKYVKEKTEAKPIILDDNELSLAKYAEEFPENFKKMNTNTDERRLE